MSPSIAPPLLPIVFVTGPSGAGRSTAINALEDLGFETIDNIPLSLLPRLVHAPMGPQPLALGTDVRNRDYSADALIGAYDDLAKRDGVQPDLLFLDCDAEVLQRRYSETRRRHPLSPDGVPSDGIAEELHLLRPVRDRASILIDTTHLTPHDLKARLTDLFAPRDGRQLGVMVTSFSYKRGLPSAADLVFDCRFLRNPHWDDALRSSTGQDPAVQDYVAQDPRYQAFRDQVFAMIDLLLPAFRDEGKSNLTIAFGCTGGQHRSVAMTELVAAHLAEAGSRVSKRHREVDQRRDDVRDGGAPMTEA